MMMIFVSYSFILFIRQQSESQAIDVAVMTAVGVGCGRNVMTRQDFVSIYIADTMRKKLNNIIIMIAHQQQQSNNKKAEAINSALAPQLFP